MAELGQDEYWLLNVEHEYRHDRTSREICCLMDNAGQMNYTVEYQGNDKLDLLVDLMLSGAGMTWL